MNLSQLTFTPESLCLQSCTSATPARKLQSITNESPESLVARPAIMKGVYSNTNLYGTAVHRHPRPSMRRPVSVKWEAARSGRCGDDSASLDAKIGHLIHPSCCQKYKNRRI